MGKKIVFWLPFDEDGKPVLDMIKGGEFDFIEKDDKDRGHGRIPVDNWKTIHDIKNTTVIKFENDPYCYTVWSDGEWVTR